MHITASTLSSMSAPCFLWLRHPPSAKVGYPIHETLITVLRDKPGDGSAFVSGT